ncbi:hypothetical protein AABB24_003942 [Solanum stoloniferum]|uniref:Uncharacterized protein n=1 Tax=Solanum stoloniferum TaxID=62892 RepID=A0ABD2V9J5_9SOLN
MASSKGSNYSDSFEKSFSKYMNDNYDIKDDGMVVTISSKGNNQMPKGNGSRLGQSSFSRNMMNPHLNSSYRVDLHIPPKDEPKDEVLENEEAQVVGEVAAAEPRPAICDVTGEGSCISSVGGLIPSAESTGKEKKSGA